MSEVLKLSSIPIGFSKIEGAQGPQGPAGPIYRLDCNVASITRGLVVPISPEEIVFSAVEINEETGASIPIVFNKEENSTKGYVIKLEDGWIGRATTELEENANEPLTIASIYTEIGKESLKYNSSCTTVTLSMMPVEKSLTSEEIETIDENADSGGYFQQGGYASGETKDEVVSIRVTLYKDGVPIVITSIPFISDPNLLVLGEIRDDGEVYIGKDKVTANSIVGNSIVAGKIASGQIETRHFFADRIISNNYEAIPEGTAEEIEVAEGEEKQTKYFYPKEIILDESGKEKIIYPYKFTNRGSFFDLSEGGLHTPGFYVTPSGDAGIKGHVEAQSGSILGTLTVGGDAVTISGDEKLPFIQAGTDFSLTQDGHLTTTSANIGGWIVDNENIYKDSNDDYAKIVGLHSGKNTLRNDSPIRFYAGSNKNIQEKEFTVTENGTLYASKANISGEINATSGFIGGKDGIIINGKDDTVPYISSAKYASGATGWIINNDGYAEFADAYIRGTLRSTVFEVGTVNAVGGDLYVAPTINIKKDDLKEIKVNDTKLIILTISNNEEDSSAVLKDAKDSSIISDQWHDAKILLDFNAKLNNVENNYNQIQGRLWFNSKEDNELERDKDKFYISFDSSDIKEDFKAEDLNNISEIFEISSGITVIKLGQGDDHHYIRLTANTSEGKLTPYIDVYSAPSTESNSLPKVRIGNLSGINDLTFGGNLSGYGLYSNNAYLTGALYLPDAGITNQSSVYYNGSGKYNKNNEGSPIRFWAGGGIPADKGEAANFVVTQDGFLYAKQGVFEGTIKAKNSKFSGTIEAAGIVIDKDKKHDIDDPIHHHFFVGYKENPTSNNDYVLDIDSEGLRIWEGGFNVYSDTLSGLKDETPADSLYGYTSENQNPYPYISAIDAGRLAVRDINIMSPIGEETFSSIYSTKGALYFGNIKAKTEKVSDFSSIESGLFTGSKNSIQIEDNTFTLKTSKAAMRIGINNSLIQAQSQNFIVYNPGAAAKMSFNNDISIEEVRQQTRDSNGIPIKDSNGNPVMETIGFNFLI